MLIIRIKTGYRKTTYNLRAAYITTVAFVSLLLFILLLTRFSLCLCLAWLSLLFSIFWDKKPRKLIKDYYIHFMKSLLSIFLIFSTLELSMNKIFENSSKVKENKNILLLDSSHALCACNNALFFWFTVIMFRSDINNHCIFFFF